MVVAVVVVAVVVVAWWQQHRRGSRLLSLPLRGGCSAYRSA